MPVYEYTARNLKGDLVQDKIDPVVLAILRVA